MTRERDAISSIDQIPFRAGFVALIGEPNAGKSTLMNAILEEKVSIVSEKPQTTRARVTGILNLPKAQIVFIDAPGAQKSTSGINKFLQEEVTDVMIKAEVLCLLLPSDGNEAVAKELVERARNSKKPWFVIITKSDLLGGTRTPKFFKYLLDEKVPFVSISTIENKEEAKQEVLARVLPLMPASPPLFDQELYTTQTLRQMAAEFVRESAFEALRQEVPYGLAVKIIEFKEDDPTIVRIRAEVVIERENHKGIVIGAKGQTLKKIGTEARKEIERVVGRKVFLELHVAVKENWTKNPRMMKELGYVVHEE